MIDTWIADLAAQLAEVPGVRAVVLGGSRATGTATAASDVDIGLYYDGAQSLDTAALDAFATTVDDAHRSGLITPIGGWGPRINGGGWLVIGDTPVDVIYRDISAVEQVIAECHAGSIRIDYQIGHPHAFCSAIYMGEVAECRPLADPHGVISRLKMRTAPMPDALRRAIVRAFWFEVDFSTGITEKAITRRDMSYVSGCLFRATASLAQVLFALNGKYLLNEKGAIARAARFDNVPRDLALRVDAVFRDMYTDPGAAVRSVNQLARETYALLAAENLL